MAADQIKQSTDQTSYNTRASTTTKEDYQVTNIGRTLPIKNKKSRLKQNKDKSHQTKQIQGLNEINASPHNLSGPPSSVGVNPHYSKTRAFDTLHGPIILETGCGVNISMDIS